MNDTDANKAAAREYLVRGLRNTRHIMAKRQNATVRFMVGNVSHVGHVTQVAREQFTYVSDLTGEEHTFLLDDVTGFAYEKLLLVPTEIADYVIFRRHHPAYTSRGEYA